MKTNFKKALRKLATLGITMLVLGSARGGAADMCFLDDYNSTLVGKKFAFPAAGACKAFNGYELGTGCIISGTACGTSDNVNIFFNLNTSCPAGYFGTSSFYIDRLYSDIDQAGYGWAAAPNLSNNSWVRTVWHIKTVPCPSPHPLEYPN
jgi:hypothetical protein